MESPSDGMPSSDAPYDDELQLDSTEAALAASSFHGWSSTGSAGLSVDPPAVVTRGSSIDAWARGLDDKVYYNYWSSLTGWLGWHAEDAVIVSKPAATAIGSTGLAVAGRGVDGRIFVNVSLPPSGSGHPLSSGWNAIPGLQFTSAPALTYYDQKIWAFAVAADQRMYYSQNALGSSSGALTYSASSWTAWTAIPNGLFLGDPAATATSSRLTVVGRALDRSYFESSTYGSSWSTWTRIPSAGMVFSSGPALTTDPVSGSTHVFGRGLDGGFFVAKTSYPSWTSFSRIPSVAGGTALSAVALASDDIYLFTPHASEDLYWNHGY